MSNILKWALKWGVSAQAVSELHLALGLDHDPSVPTSITGTSEAAVSASARILASRSGGRLWRNNVGGGTLEDGSYLRWGLCNDSPQINKVLKSSDLVGIKPVMVTPAMVGTTVGQFWAVETKAPGWRYTGTEREEAQMRFIALVESLGGRAAFWNGSGEL